jgi:anti-sigma factor RsiW
MKDCREIEPLLTPYVDGEAAHDQQAEVRAHLVLCAPCRALAQAEADARAVLRASAADLRGVAPAALGARCRSQCPSQRLRSRWMMPLAVAASLSIVLGGIALALLTNERRAWAAELSSDHERCFAREVTLPDGRSIQVGEVTVRVPDGDASMGLELTGLRRCRIRRTLMAHALYRSQGRPVSLYVAPVDEAPQIPEIMAGEVRTWTSDTGCYALVGQVTRSEMDELESFMRRPLDEHAHGEAGVR